MSGQWRSRGLRDCPHCIRPETHWFQETTQKGRKDGRLWFSLRLTLENAKELYQSFQWDGPSPFAELINKKVSGSGSKERAVMMAASSHASLRFAIDNLERPGGTHSSTNSSEMEGVGPVLGADLLVHPEAFHELVLLSEDKVIEITDAGLAVEGEVGQPQLDSVAARSNTGPEAPIPNGPIIIATIDDGIAIANHRFRATASTTRVKHFLDLALVGAPTASNPVDDLLGRSWSGYEIEKLLNQDEEQVYRALGLIDPGQGLRQPLRAAITHGTHVLDLAAGYDYSRTEGAKTAGRRPIITVQMPTQVGENRSDTWLPQSIKHALDWILVKADEVSAALSPETKKRLPLIVNGSFDSMAGPQDGCSDIERRITQFVETYRGGGHPELCTFVLSAGNSLQLRSTAQMNIPAGEVCQIAWRVQPDDKTPSFVEIWLPEVKEGGEKLQQVEVSLIPPRDGPLKNNPSRLNEAVEWWIGRHVAACLYHQRFARPGGSRERITIAIRPTADDQVGALIVPSGLWQIEVKNVMTQTLRDIDLRVHRDDVGMFAHTGARQSYFDDPNYQMFESGSGRLINDERLETPGKTRTRVTRQETLSTYAYANGVLAVGGYRHSDGEPATYSSSGGHSKRRMNDLYGQSAQAQGPDFAAVSEESPSLSGVLAAGTYSGSVAVLSGTSVAAPQVTRALADAIAGGGSVAGLKETVRARETSHSPYGQPADRPLRDGVGRLDFGHPTKAKLEASHRELSRDGPLEMTYRR